MLFPAAVQIDPLTGVLSEETGRYTKLLSEIRTLFQNQAAVDHILAKGNPVAYEVIEYKKPGSDIFFGTTIMHPGRVGDEFFMTRGHFHARRDMGEVYYTQHGEGMLLLESRNGEVREVEMRPGVCAFIPPDWAHRSVNVGETDLIFVWVCNQEAGHDYGDILKRGMRRIVVEREGRPQVIDNPSFA
jgi:glucose-6-phosphate isomerase, archaeal